MGTKNAFSLLPWQKIEEWHEEVCAACIKTISECDVLLRSTDPKEVMNKLLNNPKTAHWFGPPENTTVNLFTNLNAYADIEQRRWGQRLSYFAECMPKSFQEHLD